MADAHGSLIWFPDVFVRRPHQSAEHSRAPGGLLQAMSADHRASLVKALNGPPPADWWIKIVCGK